MNPVNIKIEHLIGTINIHLHINGANETSQLDLLAENIKITVENALKKAISAVDNGNLQVN
jgi:hypothetical protein